MFRNSRQQDAVQSSLYDQTTFYDSFVRDLRDCTQSLVIESPFITLKRINMLLPILQRLRKRQVQIVINTRDPIEHEHDYQLQAQGAIANLQEIGIEVLYTVRHHRKLAIIDRTIVWEGSLNILSYYDSCEIMRRMTSSTEAELLINFVGLQAHLRNEARLC